MLGSATLLQKAASSLGHVNQHTAGLSKGKQCQQSLYESIAC
jgi:hypothetical protein